MHKPFLLFVAGEASGDRLGHALVRDCLAQGYDAYGVGGELMQAQGLRTTIPFTDLNVSGFWDVIPRIFLLRTHLRSLQKRLFDPLCRGLVCVDYPGFNMRLMRKAREKGIPVFWVAPPQIWAWKRKRGKQFIGQTVHVFFPFEQQAYAQFGVDAVQVAHPMLSMVSSPSRNDVPNTIWALLPGSRWMQAKRNVPSLLRLGKQLESLEAGTRAVLVASDASIAHKLRLLWGAQIEILESNADSSWWTQLRGSVCPPGTASLEMALRGAPLLVFSRVDAITYVLGRLFLGIANLALPNLLLQKQYVREFVVPAVGELSDMIFADLAQWLHKQNASQSLENSAQLRNMLAGRPLNVAFQTFLLESAGTND